MHKIASGVIISLSFRILLFTSTGPTFINVLRQAPYNIPPYHKPNFVTEVLSQANSVKY